MAARNETSSTTTPDVEPKAGARLRFKNWLPVLFAVVLTPCATLAVVQFVVIPQLRKSLVAAASPDASGGAAQSRAASVRSQPSRGGAASDEGASFKFTDVVVNLAGSMGTRYLKVSFIVTGADKTLAAEFSSKKAQLLDVTLNVLSSLTLAELEEAGARNLLRERLVSSYNQTLGRRVAEQVYFADFVVQ